MATERVSREQRRLVINSALRWLRLCRRAATDPGEIGRATCVGGEDGSRTAFVR